MHCAGGKYEKSRDISGRLLTRSMIPALSSQFSSISSVFLIPTRVWYSAIRDSNRRIYTYMLRILSYNILYGGKGRVNQLTKMIQSAQPDVLGLIEAADARVIEELAERLEMHYCANPAGEYPRGMGLGVLSRLPILYSELHARPGILREPLLEVGVEEAGGTQFTVFVTHLWAAFNQGWAGNHIQQREVKEILRITAPKQGTPHLLIGDFNALAPGGAFKGSQL